jgi:hypothetical protein
LTNEVTQSAHQLLKLNSRATNDLQFIMVGQLIEIENETQLLILSIKLRLTCALKPMKDLI